MLSGGPTLDSVQIRRVTVDDVDAVRSIRLRALESDPGAFSATLEAARELTNADWTERLAGYRGRPGVVLLASDRVGDQVRDVAMVGVGESEIADGAHLWGMWVDPAARGRSIARRLVDAVVEWAAGRSMSSVGLWVMRDNQPARALYEAAGFVYDEAPVPPPTGCDDELYMRLDLGTTSEIAIGTT